MDNTERDEKQNTQYESGEQSEQTGEASESEGGSADKLPAMPAPDDDSPVGDTDQHAD